MMEQYLHITMLTVTVTYKKRQGFPLVLIRFASYMIEFLLTDRSFHLEFD